MQLLAPAAALASMQPFDPLASICSHATADQPLVDEHPTSHHDHGKHDCCPFCHLHHLGLAEDHQSYSTHLDYPVSSTRWQPRTLALVPHLAGRRPGRLRGPPRPAVPLLACSAFAASLLARRASSSLSRWPATPSTSPGASAAPRRTRGPQSRPPPSRPPRHHSLSTRCPDQPSRSIVNGAAPPTLLRLTPGLYCSGAGS